MICNFLVYTALGFFALAFLLDLTATLRTAWNSASPTIAIETAPETAPETTPTPPQPSPTTAIETAPIPRPALILSPSPIPAPTPQTSPDYAKMPVSALRKLPEVKLLPRYWTLRKSEILEALA